MSQGIKYEVMGLKRWPGLDKIRDPNFILRFLSHTSKMV